MAADQSSYFEIKVKRTDRTYRPGDRVEGVVIVHAFKGWSHSGINLLAEGNNLKTGDEIYLQVLMP